ncbi:MAG: peptidoglycan DD-metalloendopeptidase family protein [Halanaerobiaceae bacterium]
MDKKLKFKFDKDKIKVQLKDLGKKFIRKKGSYRNIFMVFLFFVLIGMGFVVYNDERNTETEKNEFIADHPDYYEHVNIDENYGEESPIFIKNKEKEQNFSLNYSDIDSSNTERDDEVVGSTKLKTEEDVESVITEPVKPASQIRDNNQGIELLKPVSGKIIQSAGWYYHPVLDDWRYQKGIQFEGLNGDIVMASADGKVKSVMEDNYKGIVVTIEHDGKWLTEYGHLQRATVSPGDVVKKGQEVGRIGNTGLASQTSLYFSLQSNNNTIDPLEFFHK